MAGMPLRRSRPQPQLAHPPLSSAHLRPAVCTTSTRPDSPAASRCAPSLKRAVKRGPYAWHARSSAAAVARPLTCASEATTSADPASPRRSAGSEPRASAADSSRASTPAAAKASRRAASAPLSSAVLASSMLPSSCVCDGCLWGVSPAGNGGAAPSPPLAAVPATPPRLPSAPAPLAPAGRPTSPCWRQLAGTWGCPHPGAPATDSLAGEGEGGLEVWVGGGWRGGWRVGWAPGSAAGMQAGCSWSLSHLSTAPVLAAGAVAHIQAAQRGLALACARGAGARLLAIEQHHAGGGVATQQRQRAAQPNDASTQHAEVGLQVGSGG